MRSTNQFPHLESGHLQLDLYRNAASQPGRDAHYNGLAIHSYPAIHERVGALAKIALAPGARVLDLGSGSGAMCMRLKDLGFAPTACDLVSENFKLHGEVEFFKINLNLRFPDAFTGSFDCVIATEVVEHLENPRYFLRQCFLALQAGGLLILSTPNVDSPLSRAAYVRTGQFRWFGDANYRQDGHITPVMLSVLRRAMEEAGFTTLAIESVAPVVFNGVSRWKTRLLAKLIEVLSKDKPPAGDVLIVSAIRPQSASSRLERAAADRGAPVASFQKPQASETRPHWSSALLRRDFRTRSDELRPEDRA